ncbi:arginine kinase Lit v 2-like isoform X1 [Bradysia coprophila]|uniref:arginine kinase Lit v 2-like isoform X1 n=1 Tax=Bradysia coprophila TaxID=38358 RepID=UPI00187DC56E|nr:arginine kinase Lit v 2-like isoform X1 [Bradysia coprophila]
MSTVGLVVDRIDEKRAAFHQYLASSGVISALSKALIKLYEEPHKPDDPVNFVRRHMGSEDFFILGDGKVQNAEEELVLSSLLEKKGDETEEVTVIDNDEIKMAESEVKSEVEQVASAEEDDKPPEDTETANTNAVEGTEGADDKTTDEEVDQLRADFEKMKSNEECDSMLKKHLTDEIFENLRNVNVDDGGVSLGDCIKSGLENHDSVLGIYATNLQCYDQFSEIFDPVIEAYHGFGKEAVQANNDWGDPQAFELFSENDEVVVSIRIGCTRNMEEYPVVCRMSEDNLNESLAKIKTTTEGFEDGTKGTFYLMSDLTEDNEAELKDIGGLMDNTDKYLSSASVYQNWPTGRGVFVADDKLMIIQVNAEDHLKFIARESSKDFGKIYQRLVDTVTLFELPLIRHDRLGWLTFCPSNLGTSLNIAVELKLPKLHSNPDKLQEIITSSPIQLKITDSGADSTYTLTNQTTLTECSEFELAKQFYDVVQAIIEFETSAE